MNDAIKATLDVLDATIKLTDAARFMDKKSLTMILTEFRAESS